jgi:hypothetical protein
MKYLPNTEQRGARGTHFEEKSEDGMSQIVDLACQGSRGLVIFVIAREGGVPSKGLASLEAPAEALASAAFQAQEIMLCPH